MQEFFVCTGNTDKDGIVYLPSCPRIGEQIVMTEKVWRVLYKVDNVRYISKDSEHSPVSPIVLYVTFLQYLR